MAFLHGLATGGGLIIAIGAQNAFVLSNGIRKNHVLTIVLICSICDALLIIAGISGVGALISGNSLLADIALWGGVGFLFLYGLRSFQSALSNNTLKKSSQIQGSLTGILLATLAVTLLNPHVYLDTMILIGSIGSQFIGTERLLFGAGAICASFLWFFILGYGGGRLAPFFQKASSWKILDGMVGIIMISLAVSLLL